MAHMEVHGGNFQLVAHFPLLTLMFLIGGCSSCFIFLSVWSHPKPQTLNLNP